MEQDNFKVLIDGAAFRVCTISTVDITKLNSELDFFNNPVSYGLSIEKAIYENGKDKHYIVVALVYWDEDEHEVYIEDCNLRTIYELQDLTPIELDEYFNCMDFAINVLNDVNKGVTK